MYPEQVLVSKNGLWVFLVVSPELDSYYFCRQWLYM